MINVRKHAILFGSSLLFIVAGCSEPAQAPTGADLPPVTVRVETVALSKVLFRIEVTANVRALEQAEIAAKVSGPVKEVTVQAGSRVKKGELLVRISASEISARLRQAETQRAQARRNYEREARLLQTGASTAVMVKALEESVQMANAAYREAEAMLAYTQILAPFSGTITHKLVEVGDLALPGVLLLKMENSAGHEVVAQIPEALIQSLAVGERLQLSIPAAGFATSAAISEIAPTVDPQSRSTRIKLALPDNPALRSGQFARVALSGDGEQTVLIPAAALKHKGQMEQVLVADQGVARLRLVRTGATYGDRIEILTGLKPGEQVVIDSDGRVLDGQPLVVDAGQTQ